MHGCSSWLPASVGPAPGRRLAGTVLTFLWPLTLVLLPACSVLRAPQKMVKEVVPDDRSKQPDPVDLELQVQRFADNYSTRAAEAIGEYARQVGTVSARLEALLPAGRRSARLVMVG